MEHEFNSLSLLADNLPLEVYKKGLSMNIIKMNLCSFIINIK